MGEKKENSHHDNYHKIFLGTEDKEIVEKKPPNEKIIDFNIVEENIENEK